MTWQKINKFLLHKDLSKNINGKEKWQRILQDWQTWKSKSKYERVKSEKWNGQQKENSFKSKRFKRGHLQTSEQIVLN